MNIRVSDAEGMVGSDVPLLVYGHPDTGPTVSIMAGVHGCEYTSMLALRQFLDSLDESKLEGCLRVVPIANLASFHARSAFVVPHDAKNLNRCFPGDPTGTFTDRLAFALFEELIRPADFHIDMHCGDIVEDLVPFAMYDVSEVAESSQLMAHVYGLDYVIRSERGESPIAGTSSAAAAEVGIPAITAEVGGQGLLDPGLVARHQTGLRRVLNAIGVLPDTLEPALESVEIARWTWLRSTLAGWWEFHIRVGQTVSAGEVLGVVTTLDGSEQEVIVAPETGTALFLTSSPAVEAGGLLLGFGAL
jgi:hypothetical protein